MSATHAYPELIFHLASMPKLTCMTCGDSMLLEHIEPISTHYDLRTFVCLECNVCESFVVDLSQP